MVEDESLLLLMSVDGFSISSIGHLSHLHYWRLNANQRREIDAVPTILEKNDKLKTRRFFYALPLS